MGNNSGIILGTNREDGGYMQVDTVIKEVVRLCRKYAAEEVILFGSRAKGTELERSDIDIAVSGASDFDALAEEVDQIPTLYTVDLLDLESCGNELLLEDIEKYGQKIYEKV